MFTSIMQEHQIRDMYRYVCTFVCSLNINSSVLHFTYLFISTMYGLYGLWVAIHIIYIYKTE